MSDRRYHVGRVNGSGPVFRLASRFEAASKIAELIGQNPGTVGDDYYVDGPPEPDPWEEQVKQVADEVSEDLEKNEDSSESLKQIMRLAKLSAMKKVVFANKLSNLLGSPATLSAACMVYLGVKLGKAESERERLEKMHPEG